MNTQTCALFAQVIPVLFIAAFIGGQRITHVEGGVQPVRERIRRIFIALILMGGAVAESLAIWGAAFTRGIDVNAGRFILITALMLTAVMAASALRGFTTFKPGEQGKHADKDND